MQNLPYYFVWSVKAVQDHKKYNLKWLYGTYSTVINFVKVLQIMCCHLQLETNNQNTAQLS